MVFRLNRINSTLRVGFVAALLAVALLPAAPVLAASGRNFHRDDNVEAGDSAPFDVDPDPCLVHGHRAVTAGNPNCYVRPNVPLRGNAGPRHPGSSAFGLQFDNGYD